jgi:penicillin-binding protein 1A
MWSSDKKKAGRKAGKKERRIEPGFRVEKRPSADIVVTGEDRVVSSGSSKRRGAGASGSARKSAPAALAESARTKRKTARARRGRGLIGGLVYWSLVAAIWCGIAATAIVGYYTVQLPQMSTWRVPDRPPNARIVSVDGALIANRGATGGEAMRLDEMSPYLPQAVIAIEDHRFRQHFGVDPLGLARAFTANLFAGRTVQGGSTLTQQLAKNLFLEPDRTLGRKIQEAVLALWLETRFSKDQILELYLNRVYFGSGAWGADAAARRYFNKSAGELTLGEAATLAGLLKAPSRLSPARDPQAAKDRADLVLAAMQREGMIGKDDAVHAMALEAKGARRYWSGSRHYAADMVMAELAGLVGEWNSDIVVETSIDMHLQSLAGKVLREAIDDAAGKKVTQGALVALDGTGAIRAVVGGREYADSQFNRATEARRQPGSAFKPFVYLAALEAGRTPESVRSDSPVRFGKWSPQNHDGKYRGEVTLTQALAHSLNTVAARLTVETGPGEVARTARRLGIEMPKKPDASIALGTYETTLLSLTAAYASFANGGFEVLPWTISRVTTTSGKLLYERKHATPQIVIGMREVAMMNHMLSATLREGTGRKAAFDGWPAAGKTGTTQNFRDAWFVGYTANLVAGIWFGNDDGASMQEVTGGGLPASSWSKFMQMAHAGIPPLPLPGNYRPQHEDGLVAENDGESRQPSFGEMVAGVEQQGAIAAEPAAARQRPRGILELLFGKRADPG